MFARFFPSLDRLRAFERQRQHLIIVFLWSQRNVDPTHSPPGIPCPFSLPADFVTTGPAIEWNLYFWILQQQLPSLNCTNWNWAYASLSLATFFFLHQPEILSSLERVIMPVCEPSTSLCVFIGAWEPWKDSKHHPWSIMKGKECTRMRMMSSTRV